MTFAQPSRVARFTLNRVQGRCPTVPRSENITCRSLPTIVRENKREAEWSEPGTEYHASLPQLLPSIHPFYTSSFHPTDTHTHIYTRSETRERSPSQAANGPPVTVQICTLNLARGKRNDRRLGESLLVSKLGRVAERVSDCYVRIWDTGVDVSSTWNEARRLKRVLFLLSLRSFDKTAPLLISCLTVQSCPPPFLPGRD